MRRVVVFACILSLATTGCATQRAEFVPPGEDRAELAAAIARQGQDSSPTPGPSGYATPPLLTPLDKGVQLAVVAAPYVVGCVLLAPVIALYIMAPGPKPPLPFNFNSSSSN
jgi:hypothetical protein